MLPEEIITLFKQYKFVTLATSTPVGRPNAAPKFLLDIQGDSVYLVDYVINRIFKNIELNPYVAITVVDEKTLTGYELLGKARVLTEGYDYDAMVEMLKTKIRNMSVERIVHSIRTGVKSDDHHQLPMADKVAIFKVKVTEIVVIGPSGDLKREKIGSLRVQLAKTAEDTTVPTDSIPLLIPQDFEEPAKKDLNEPRKDCMA